MEAKFQRKLKSGTQYDALMPKCKGIDTLLMRGNAGVPDTMVALVKMVYETVADTKLLAPLLIGKTLKDTTKNIWSFIHDHIQYKPDEPGNEQLRRPSRSWKDRKTGVDCDCYSITASSILVNLGIPHLLRITKYDGKPNYQHIYVIVPKNGDTSDKNIETRSNYIVIDCVPEHYDFEAPYTDYYDFAIIPKGARVNTSVNGLMGLGDLRTVQEFPLTDLTLPSEITSSTATTSNSEPQIIDNSFFKTIATAPQSINPNEAVTPTTQTDDSSAKNATGKKKRGGSTILACIFGASALLLGSTAFIQATPLKK